MKGVQIAFHKFPLKNPELLKRWIHALKRSDFVPTKHSCICSEHFLPNDYNFCPPDKDFAVHNHKPVLKFNAVPSLFVFNKETKKTPRKPPVIREPLKRKKNVVCISPVAKKENLLLEEPVLPDVDFEVNDDDVVVDRTPVP